VAYELAVDPDTMRVSFRATPATVE